LSLPLNYTSILILK